MLSSGFFFPFELVHSEKYLHPCNPSQKFVKVAVTTICTEDVSLAVTDDLITGFYCRGHYRCHSIEYVLLGEVLTAAMISLAAFFVNIWNSSLDQYSV